MRSYRGFRHFAVGGHRVRCLALALVMGAAGSAHAAPTDPCDAIRVEEVPVPAVPGGDAIWGATGRDASGALWFGVSAKRPGDSARLLRLDPATLAWTDAGSVHEALDATVGRAPGEGQVKMHSRIEPTADGWLAFTSMDEAGEREDGSALPRWGSHLWQVHPGTLAWRHRLVAPEGLVAAGAAGTAVFALGYWNHVLYRFDTRDGSARRTVVGAVGGHASRNLVVDPSGHAHVPRVWRDAAGTLHAELASFDAELREVAVHPLPGYFAGETPEANHGIVALAPDGRGGMRFVTHHGQWFGIAPGPDGVPRVSPLGPLHPGGSVYAPALVHLPELGRHAALARRHLPGAGYELILAETDGPGRSVCPLSFGERRELLLYGSMTRDDAGWMYFAGRARRLQAAGLDAVVVRVRVGR
jgi:hypothetical protein